MPDGSQKKISELPVAPAAHPTDLLETSQADGTGYVSRSITLAQVAAGVVAPPPAWTDITGKPATFPPTLPIPESGVTNLVTDLAGKAPVSHSHTAGDLPPYPTSLPPSGTAGGALTGSYPNPTLVGGPLSNYLTTATAATTYAPVVHTHTASQITDFSEATDDRVAALLVAGTNITLAYNDPANTLTINSTASGGGGGTVTSVSVVSANGLAGTVATPTATPAITLSTTVSGLLKGNGTAISAATAGTDYMTPGNVSAAYQPLDSGLTALSSIGTGMLANTAADTFTPRTITGTASRLSVTNGNGVAGNPTLDIAAAYDALWAPVSHSQTASTITDFSEAVDDRVAALLVAGTNITLSYNDPANTLTINSTGGGGASVTVSDTAPGSPSSGALWWNSTLGVMFIWYTDPNTSQWVPVTPSGGTSPPNAIPQNAQTGNYTLVAQDAGQHIYHAVAAAAATYTIPANSSVPFVIGTTVTFVNDSANAITLAITSDTLIWSPGTTAGSRTLGTGGIATALKVTATRWILNGTALT